MEDAVATHNSDNVVISHTKLPSCESNVVASSSRQMQPPPATLANAQLSQKFRTRRLTVRVIKDGDKLGFRVRHDRYKRLQVSTLQDESSQLRVGDTLLSVNGVDLTGQAFVAVVQLLKGTKPGELLLDIERQDGAEAELAEAAATATTGAVSTAPETAVLPFQVLLSSNSVSSGAKVGKRTLSLTALVPQTNAPSPSIPVTAGVPVSRAEQPKKRARTLTTLVADLNKERAEKAALEEKNAKLRKRLQQMLIENDEVRVRARNEVAAAQEKAKGEIADAQSQLAAARAQLRLQDRGPNVAREDSIMNELNMCKVQLERLKKANMEQTRVLTTRYGDECRLATADAQRVLDSVVEMFRTKLRLVGRMSRDGTTKPELEVACDGVRRLAFMKFFSLAHDFAFYMSAAFHSEDPVHYTLEQSQFVDLFGNLLCHEERAGFFYVAIAPMLVVFDPSAESVILKCKWTEQNALRDLARNLRF